MDEAWGRMGIHNIDGHYDVYWCFILERSLYSTRRDYVVCSARTKSEYSVSTGYPRLGKRRPIVLRTMILIL
jgi:hypothetical protein